MLLHLACLFTIMLTMSGCFTSLKKVATLTVVVGALCRLADAGNLTTYPECAIVFDWVG